MRAVHVVPLQPHLLLCLPFVSDQAKNKQAKRREISVNDDDDDDDNGDDDKNDDDDIVCLTPP